MVIDIILVVIIIFVVVAAAAAAAAAAYNNTMMDGYQVRGHCCVCQRDRTRERASERETEREGGKGVVQQRERMRTNEGERRRREGRYEGARGGGGRGRNEGQKERGGNTTRRYVSVCFCACHVSFMIWGRGRLIFGTLWTLWHRGVTDRVRREGERSIFLYFIFYIFIDIMTWGRDRPSAP